MRFVTFVSGWQFRDPSIVRELERERGPQIRKLEHCFPVETIEARACGGMAAQEALSGTVTLVTGQETKVNEKMKNENTKIFFK